MTADRGGSAGGDAQFGLGQRVAFATLIQIVGKVVVLAIVLLSTRIVTNYLGVDAFGDYAIVLTGATLVLAIGDLGITMLLVREISRDPVRTARIAGNMLFLRLCTCGCIMVLALVAIPFLPFPGRVRDGLVLAVFGALLGVISLFPTVFFQIHLRLELAVVVDVTTRAVALGVIALVVALDGGFLPLVAATPVAWAVAVVVAFWLSSRFWRPRIRSDGPELRRLVRAVVPLSLVVTLGLLHFKIDAVMLAFLKPTADVGIYAIAYSAVEQSVILPSLFMAAVFPILSRLVHAADGGARDVIEKSFRFLVVLALVVSVSIFTLAAPFVRLVSNASYAAAVTPLRILAFAVVPLFAGAVFVGLLVAIGDLRQLAVVSATGVAANVALNAFLIPAYSYTGAAVSTVVSEAVVMLAVTVVAIRASGIRVGRNTVVRLVAVAAAAGAALGATHGSRWWVAAPISLAVCLGSTLGLGMVTATDIRSLVAGREASHGD